MLPAVSHPAQICVPTAKGSTEPSVASISFISRHLSELLEENGNFFIFTGIYNCCLVGDLLLSWETENQQTATEGRFCCQPSPLANSKASCLKSARDFYLLISPAEQAYKKICQIPLAGKTAAEEGKKPAACPQYQLSPPPIKVAAHTGSSRLKNARRGKTR